MNLIVCGDSWSNGAELRPGEKTFGELLAQKLNATFYNQSVDASSIPHLIMQLKKLLDLVDLSQPTSAVFFLTSPHRDLIWSDHLPRGSGFVESRPLPHEKFEEIFLNPNDPLHTEWYAKYHSKKLSEFRCNTSLITLQSMCRYYNIKDYYIWGWTTFDLWPEVNLSRFYNRGNSRVFDFFTDNPAQAPNPEFNKTCKYIWPNGSHPNQLGHQLIADMLFPWITDVY